MAQPSPVIARQEPASGNVHVAIADSIATIRFEHPKGNSLPAALLAKLAEQIRSAGARNDVNLIILRSGDTGPFCAGASFDELKAITDATAGKEFFMGFARVILSMIRCPKLIVTRVHGKVVGGGVGLVAASDYVLAVETASLRLSELAVGIGPFVVGPAIERKIGLGGFSAMAIDAEWRTARWAEQYGLYSLLFDSINALDSGLDLFGRKLSRTNPQAMAKLKSVFWQGTGEWDRLLEDRAAMSGELVTSEFTRSAIAAFERS